MLKKEILKKNFLSYLNKSLENLKYVAALKERNSFAKGINSTYSVLYFLNYRVLY